MTRFLMAIWFLLLPVASNAQLLPPVSFDQCMEDSARFGQAARYDRLRVQQILTLNKPAAVSARAQHIVDRLLRKVVLPEGASVELKAYKSKIINAHAGSDGVILLSEALWDSRRGLSDDEMAMVLAHEISHVVLRHSLKQGCTALSWMSTGSLTLGEALFDITESFGAPTNALDSKWSTLSAQMELEADAMGLRLMHAAGYDSHAAIVMLRKISRTAGAGKDVPSRSHPSIAVRVKRLNAMM